MPHVFGSIYRSITLAFLRRSRAARPRPASRSTGSGRSCGARVHGPDGSGRPAWQDPRAPDDAERRDGPGPRPRRGGPSRISLSMSPRSSPCTSMPSPTLSSRGVGRTCGQVPPRGRMRRRSQRAAAQDRQAASEGVIGATPISSIPTGSPRRRRRALAWLGPSSTRDQRQRTRSMTGSPVAQRPRVHHRARRPLPRSASWSRGRSQRSRGSSAFRRSGARTTGC